MWLSTLAATVFAQDTTAPRRMIVLEISSSSRAPVGTQQKWIQMLQDVGADKVTSRTGSSGTPTVEETRTTNSILVRVTGFIVGGQLKLPGGSFSIRDTAGIRELVSRLRDDGAKVALAEKKAFGMTSEQLVELHQQLSEPVDFPTTGRNVGDVVSKLTAKSGLTFVLDAAARVAVNGNETVAEEFNGISIGTALAAVVRPLGLVVQPKREQGKSVEVHLIDSRSVQGEHWPIGWPISQAPLAVEPKLFDRLDIEIRGFPMKDALDAVEKRAGVPFFYDHNTLAREGIELTETKVTLVQKQASLMVAISKLLRQTKPRLSEELRIDENGKPFLWITVK
jgi:hypothetical protein